MKTKIEDCNDQQLRIAFRTAMRLEPQVLVPQTVQQVGSDTEPLTVTQRQQLIYFTRECGFAYTTI